MHLVCFGDSICYGYGARPGEGWVAQMTRMLATLREPVAVTNAGVSGDTTEDGLRRMQWDVERHTPSRLRPVRPQRRQLLVYVRGSASGRLQNLPRQHGRNHPALVPQRGRIPSFWPPTTGLRKRRTSLEPNSTAAPSENTTKGCGLPFQG